MSGSQRITAVRQIAAGNDRTPAVSRHLATINEVQQTAKRVREWYEKRTRWSVTVLSTDSLYPAAHRWFTDRSSATAPPRSLEARQVFVRDRERDTRHPELQVFYDDTAPRTVMIGGHKVVVRLKKADGTANDDGGDAGETIAPSSNRQGGWARPDAVKFHTGSRDAQQAVIEMLAGLVTADRTDKPALYLLTSWGGWERRDDLPPRDLNSVVLRTGELERIRGDLERFIAAEGGYNRRGIPWHRGYLLHGPPGTGKTSVVRALAAHFGLDIWYAPLGDVSKDANLLSLVAAVRPRSILLLEDVDVFHAARDRDDNQGGASMAGLLNALDGVSTPHGLITFLTSNHADVIDPALLRPGRVDLQVHIDLPDADQVGRLFRQFYAVSNAPAGLWSKGKTTAEYVETFKRHMDDPSGAAAELVRAHQPKAAA